MQRKIMPAIVSAIASILLLTSLCVLLSLRSPDASATTPKIIGQLLSPATTATSSTSTAAQSTSGIDPIIIAALIAALFGIAGIVVGALITRAFEKKKQAEQFQHDQEMERLRQTEQFKHDQEIERIRKELEAQYRAKEQEEQREETKAETLRLKMLLAQTNAERAKAYRQSVHTDPRISRLQILDMSRPLEVTRMCAGPLLSL